MLKVYNTLSQSLEEFTPQNKNIVNMYVCGITPYDDVHLGHGRCYVVFDVIRRFLKYQGYKVNYVQNFTDIDDKIIKRAKEQNIAVKDLAQKYIDSFFEIEKELNISPADVYPRVTEHIEDIILAIEKLIKKGFAYETQTGVYFDISTFKEYGKLSKRSTESLIAGARVEIDESKRSPLDFALWKKIKDKEDVFWLSPWGKGRPGWHIECSVMSMKYLAQTLDIHGGGQDLIFPHHENEITQSEGLTGKQFVRYWIHNGFVTINKEKMSKSLNNILSLKEIFKEFHPMVIRIFLLSQHYRSPIDFSIEELRQFSTVYERLKNLKEEISFALSRSIQELPVDEVIFSQIENITSEFRDAMQNDFNTSVAFAVLHKLVNLINNRVYKTKNKAELEILNTNFILLLDLLGIRITTDVDIPSDIIELVEKREAARKLKDFKLSDEIRSEIQKKGYFVEDTVIGPKIKKIS